MHNISTFLYKYILLKQNIYLIDYFQAICPLHQTKQTQKKVTLYIFFITCEQLASVSQLFLWIVKHEIIVTYLYTKVN